MPLPISSPAVQPAVQLPLHQTKFYSLTHGHTTQTLANDAPQLILRSDPLASVSHSTLSGPLI
ncbi:hypothetical protein B0H11DRAFT_1860273 [Mycena galericulata]|nr:hypothetical protein B0H11DRAFT_1868999 [Mycena galericulata]KAJ7489722.1 hypothetical protein B0H11DRAFT_1860273 [Mycena galericulata]